MDFTLGGFDGLVGSENGFPSLVSEPEARQKGYGSGFFKRERFGSAEEDSSSNRSLKMVRTDDFSASKTMLLPQRSLSLLRSNSLSSDGQQQQQHMLSFSSPKSEALLLCNGGGLVERSLQSSTSPYYHHPSSVYNRNTGLGSGSGSLNGNMHGILTGVRAPFTQSQWLELEHQALIFKYITANVPIPPNLLIPIRKALNPSGFTGLSPGSLRPNPLGWGSFHLGFSSGNTDPEPGRCRRTDGKKWRCSRDAVVDQKYCERHMNRGRHRSRKPVEGQTGHAVPGPSATTKVMPMASSSASVVVSGGGAPPPESLTITQHQIKNLQPSATYPSVTTHNNNRMLLNKESVGNRMEDSQGLSILPFSFSKQHNPFEDSSESEFGLVSSDSFNNPSQRNSFMNCDQEHQSQHPLRHFIDDWPKNRSDRFDLSWPEVEEIQLDRTQLSISIPVASSDFSSSSSSPIHDKLTLSPLRLSREFDPIQMGLGVGSILNEPNQRQANWVPISWETSMGGPLGEVLHNTSNSSGDCKNSSTSALNLMTEGWDASPSLRTSPTGVLQKTSFGSLSNSSSGSSPRAENKRIHEGTSLCDALLG